MNIMRRNLRITAIWGLVLVLLILVACGVQPETPLPVAMPLGTPEEISAQATLAAAQTQEIISANNQAAATAEFVLANAQATLNSANATLSAAQTQEQNSANILAAQIAATAEIVRANVQATVNSASSTQSAALAQNAIMQTQAAYNLQVTEAAGTQSAEAMMTQQYKNDLAASTQTAVANLIATQTQSAVATSQWYTDQSRQREEQRQAPITFLWMWCLPIFGVLFAGFCLWGFWRWLKIKQNRQRIAEQPIEILQPPVDRSEPQDRFLPPEGNIVDSRYPPAKPDNQVRGWLDEIKRKLLNREKDDDDNPDD
ncbi:MAG: hypothetical protein ABSB41_17245 [Anaerolineales bacterium]|jgi:hypothetical protein